MSMISSLISKSVPSAHVSNTAGTSQLFKPPKNGQEARPKRKPGSGRPKGSTSAVALQDRPHRLGRPPGTGHLQKARALAGTPQEDKRPIGRPRKIQAASTPATSIDFGPLVRSPGNFSIYIH